MGQVVWGKGQEAKILAEEALTIAERCEYCLKQAMDSQFSRRPQPGGERPQNQPAPRGHRLRTRLVRRPAALLQTSVGAGRKNAAAIGRGVAENFVDMLVVAPSGADPEGPATS